MIDGKQCTLCWYVDDNKLSHVDTKVVDSVLDIIKSHFGEHLVISRGKVHNFLGMKITICEDKRIKIEMEDNIRETLSKFPEDLSTKVSSIATKKIFTVSDDSPELDDERSVLFHSIVASLLFLMKRGRPDIEPAVSFLMTRVSKSTEEDWGKLKRVLQFLNQTVTDCRYIGANDLESFFTYIDAAYGVHQNMRSHTGGCQTFGIGMVHCKSSKQRINTKSSTESELVGFSDYIPYTIWIRLFLASQGYKLKRNIVFQDNKSAMLMEINGRNSCTGNSQHIDVRYFFVTDRIDKGQFSVEHCPTLLMIADYFTKPLQGQLFHKFRNIIMGYVPVCFPDESLPTPCQNQERVRNGNSVQKCEQSFTYY